MKFFIYSLLIALTFTSSAYAGVCTAHVERVCKPNTACRPSETHTLIKNSQDECLAHAKTFCTVHLTDSIISKQISANFEGISIAGGQNLCK